MRGNHQLLGTTFCPWRPRPNHKSRSFLPLGDMPSAFRRKQHFRIIDLHGCQVVDFMAWRQPCQAAGVAATERFSTSYTRYALGSLRAPTTNDIPFSNHDRPMFLITADTVHAHDMLYMACNPSFYSRLNLPGHRSCAQNVAEAMRPYGMQNWTEVIDPLNLFQNTPYYVVNEELSKVSRREDFVEMQVLMDVVVAISSCPYTEG